MKKLFFILASTSLGISAFAADTSAQFRSYLNGMLPKLTKAFDTMDPKFFKAISAPDFTETVGGKTYTKEQAMQQMVQQFAMTKSMKCHFRILSAKASGNTGIAMTAGHFTSVLKPGQDGKTHTLMMDMWEKETWVKTGKGWKIKSLKEAKPPKSTMDGHPFDPSKMGG